MIDFSSFPFIAPLRQVLSEEGYQQPTPIQTKTIPAALEGRDILGIAQTGTGKTAAFALPILNQLGSQPRKSLPHQPFVLILAPTRELAIQIGDSLATYGRHLHLRTCTIHGGVGQGKQVQQLKRGAHILVATPGRLLDLMNQGHVRLNQLTVFVLDEADRMLDMGFLPDLKKIIRALPSQRQSLFFSATLPSTIQSLAKQLLVDPVSINIAPRSVSVEQIAQRFILVEKKEKQLLLGKLLMGTDVDRAIVFTKTKRGANRLSEDLEKYGIRSVAIHGNKSQAARQKSLAAFRDKRAKVLVATDVAARGLDISGVSHVVNFDLPREPESYVHRIGRTGRAGAEGVAVSFCLPEEKRELRAIEKFIGKKVHLGLSPATEAASRERPQLESDQPDTGRPHRTAAGQRGAGKPKRDRKTGASATRTNSPQGAGQQGAGQQGAGQQEEGRQGARKQGKAAGRQGGGRQGKSAGQQGENSLENERRPKRKPVSPKMSKKGGLAGAGSKTRKTRRKGKTRRQGNAFSA